jgi:hypothetical protein
MTTVKTGKCGYSGTVNLNRVDYNSKITSSKLGSKDALVTRD